ncbi:MAG: GNAT family N-acetyltransferase [Candidatus Sulfotelmatobacter sp.]
MKIRKASADDIRFLIETGRDALSAQWSERQFWDLFEGTRGDISRLVLVAEQETEDAEDVLPRGATAHRCAIAAFLVARHVAAEWELENIVVSSAARRNRLGTELVNALLDAARDLDSEAVFLEVRESNTAARGLYEKVGFRETGRRKSYYANPLEDAVLYRLDLP